MSPAAPPRDAAASAFRVGIVLALLAAFGFSFKAILIKLAYPYGVGAVPLLTLRMLGSLPFFVVAGWRAGRDQPPLTTPDRVRLLLLGLVGYYGASLFDFLGLELVSAGLERLVLFTYPALTVLIGVLVQGRRFAPRAALGLALTWVGIGLAVLHDLRLDGDATRTLTGVGLVLLSALCYAGYLAGAGDLIERLGTARFTAWAMGISTAAVFVHFAVTEPITALVQPAPVYLLAALMAVVSTVAPGFLLSAAIKRIGSMQAATLGTLGPVLTIGLGVVILGEPLSVAQVAGAALVLGGVTLATRSGR